MVNPGGFTGLRKQFLDSQQAVYAAAVKGKHAADTVADIQRRYFKRFPVTLSHTEEPTEELLAAVDDDAPDPELKPPELDGLEPEARARAVRVYEFSIAELKMRKDVRIIFLQYVAIILTQFLFSKLNDGCSTNTTKPRDRKQSSRSALTTRWPS